MLEVAEQAIAVEILHIVEHLLQSVVERIAVLKALDSKPHRNPLTTLRSAVSESLQKMPKHKLDPTWVLLALHNIHVGIRYGLQGMRERASQIGAELDLSSAPGQGTKVSLCMPVNPRTPLPAHEGKLEAV